MEGLIAILQQKEMIKESIAAAQGDDKEIQKLAQSLAEIEQDLENHHQELIGLGKRKATPPSVAASSGSLNPNMSIPAAASPAAGSASMPAVVTPRASTAVAKKSPSKSPDQKKQRVSTLDDADAFMEPDDFD